MMLEHFTEYRKMLKISPITLYVLRQALSKTWKSFVNWTCEKLSHISSGATYNLQTVLGFG